jgi:hypothetical protein
VVPQNKLVQNTNHRNAVRRKHAFTTLICFRTLVDQF